MTTASFTYNRTIPAVTKEVAEKIKQLVSASDRHASVILFGSRARGDASEESDWDFLVLTDRDDAASLADTLRIKIRKEVEVPLNIAVSLIVKNRQVWEDDYAVTNIYESIAAEGLAL